MRRTATAKAVSSPVAGSHGDGAAEGFSGAGRPLSRRQIGARAVKLAFIAAALAANVPPSSGLEGLGKRVADEELQEMRGKFVRPDNVSYFGISLMTSWQNADNITTSAVLLFSVDFLEGAGNLEGASPVIAMSWNRDCEGCADPGMDVAGFGPDAQNGYVAITPALQVIPVGGLDNVTGAVQSQQIGGNDNRVLNGMQIAVLPASVAKGLAPADLEKVSQGSTSQTFADGSSIAFTIGANELGISMANGAGTSLVRQGVSGTLSQAAQHVLLNDNLNSVNNAMSITIGLEESGHSQRIQVDNALAAMKGRF